TTDAARNPLIEAIERFPADVPEPGRKRIRAEAARLIAERAAPAFAKLRDFFVNDYLPRCRETIAWSALPDGADWYQFEVRRHTTTRLTPRQIHELGISEVRRIRSQMDRIVAQAGFSDLSHYKRHLQTDPKYFYSDAKQLLLVYRDIAKRIDPE